MNQPTQEQIKEFWERCGFTTINKSAVEIWRHPSGLETNWLPELDLNNLFKYAVPKLGVQKIVFGGLDEWDCHLYTYGKGIKFIDYLGKPQKTDCFVGSSENPALALFWAIGEALKEKGGK